ncbi:hypothetical protein B0H13DRAFT_2025167 [Mycena leptocephala]|nr:hypothetical protein B0H13DRAFT_2025167 [Mycena leptocephala]
MPDASAGDDAGAGDESNGNLDAFGTDNEDANNDPAPLDPRPQQGQQYAAIAAAAHGNGLRSQVYLFANPPAPAPIAPQNATITAPQMTPYPQPTPAPLVQHAPFLGFPTRDQLASETPTHCPADLDHPRCQRNEGHFRRKVVAIHKYLENAQPGLAKAILKNPSNYLLLPLINGGCVAPTATTFGKITQIISGEASEDEIQVFDFGRINSPVAAVCMLAVDTYGHSEDISFSVVQADPSLFPWVVSIHKVPGARTPAAQEAACRTFRGVLGETIIATPPLRLAIDCASPPDDTRSSDICLLELIRSIDPRWDPLMNAIVTYAHPCTTDVVIWETVIDALCGLTLMDDELLIFEPMLEAGSAGNDPRCVLCKNECHFAQGCPLTKSGMTWWGAKDQIKNVTNGALAGCGGGNRGGGHGAQGNAYNRGGFRGNGGGGFNGNGNGGGHGGRGRGGHGRGS